MPYDKHLPPIRHLSSVARHTQFPASRIELVRTAETRHAQDSVIDLLRLFPADVRFEDHTDFMTRCEELEMLIKQERESPKEPMLSPQD